MSVEHQGCVSTSVIIARRMSRESGPGSGSLCRGTEMLRYEDELEVSEAVAAVQLWLCIICACQAPLFRPFRRARRRAWQAQRSPLISITLLSGAVVILPARKLLGKDRLQKM